MADVIQYSQYGGPEVLEFVQEDAPTAPDDGVVVEIRAAGVNPADWKHRSGLRASGPLTAPRRVGFDGSGVIVEAGPGVTDWAVGDEVILHSADGTYASHVVAYPGQLVRKPPRLSFEEGAAIGVTAGTAYQALRSLEVSPGTTLLVHGGSGGVGQAAIQFARRWGLQVVATASARNQDRLRELGAIPVVYGPGLADRVRAAAPGGIDVVLDAVGTDEALEASFELVADRSRIGTVVAGKRAAELGIQAWSGGNPIPLTEEQQALRAEGVEAAARLAAEGELEFEITARYPLAQAADAHRESERGHVRGKIVLLP